MKSGTNLYAAQHGRHCLSAWRAQLQGNSLNPLIATCAAIDPFMVPLLRAARDSIVTVGQPLRGAQVSRRKMARLVEPCILLLDDQPISTGPNGWPGIGYAREWPSETWIMGTDANAEDTALAVDLARRCHRLLIVRTTDAHAPSWAAWIGECATMVARWETGLPPRERVQ